MRAVDVRPEHVSPGALLGTGTPRLSWRADGVPDGWTQEWAELELTRDGVPGAPETARVEGTAQLLVAWPFAPLPSGAAAGVRVRFAGSDWSEPCALRVGLLAASDWTAAMISPEPDAAGPTPRPAMLLRGQVSLREAPARATWYVTARGLATPEVNGGRVGDVELLPGWTSYHHRLRYYSFDVTDRLAAGANVLGAWLADGWYRGFVGFEGGVRNHYGDRTGFLGQLEVTYPDGTRETFGTDASWRSATSPITAAGLYEGETHDARALPVGWSAPGFDDARWGGVSVADFDHATLVAPEGPPVRCTAELGVVEVITTPSGKTVLDFGQNAAGRLRLRLRGPAGAVVTLRHAEVLENGELGTRPLRQAAATDRYVLAGGGEETWEPRFTIHGFRYAEVAGWPAASGPIAEGVTFRVLHSDLERTGHWASSDELLNRLHENVRWGMVSNFVDVPTDCPQRDERLGWTGDIGVFAPTASYLYDTAGFLSSWLKDLAAEQAELGFVPIYVPYVPTVFPNIPYAVWGDAATLVPWAVYERGGDLGVLADAYDSMRDWVDTVLALAGPGRLWDRGAQLGDWLDPTAPPEDPLQARTSGELVATAYLARSARILADSASALGRDADAARYGAVADEVVAAFDAAYVTPDGRVVDTTQTAYALALEFGLIRGDERRALAAGRLAALVEESNFHISSGFAGTPLLCDALAGGGHLDEAYHLLQTRTCPSWLYPVTMGATTVWERWDSMLPDGTINPGDMTSFNHYALGAVADFLHRVVAGLAPAEPGYRTILVAPRPGGGLTWASARLRTPYGEASVSWERAGGRLSVRAVVPPGASAIVDLPGRPRAVVASGTHAFECDYRAAEADPPRPPDLGAFDRLRARAATVTSGRADVKE